MEGKPFSAYAERVSSREGRCGGCGYSMAMRLADGSRAAVRGMVAFFPKPISKQQLALMLADVLLSRIS